MRKLGFTFLVVIVVCLVFLISSGCVSAQTSNVVTVRAFLSNPQPQQGENISVLFFFQNNSNDSLTINYVGLHFDWMPADSFYGLNSSSSPIIVPAEGTYTFPRSINITVPADATVSVHTYYVGVDGTEGASETAFSVSSDVADFLVVSNGQSTTPSTSTNSGQPTNQQNLILYAAVGAAIIIVVLLVLVLVMRKNRTKPKKTPNQETNLPPPPPPTSPSEKKPTSGPDFDI